MGAGPPRGFGSVRVEATVGGTTWRTSVFPDSRGGSYVLPVKRAVREAEDLDDGDQVTGPNPALLGRARCSCLRTHSARDSLKRGA